MPVYVDKKTGVPRHIPKGYEGDKYVEQGKVRAPIRWARLAGSVAAFFGMSYIYFTIVASIEEENAKDLRARRKDKLMEMKEDDEEMFKLLLSRGQIGVADIHPIEKPLDAKAMKEKIFPDQNKMHEKSSGA